MSDFTILTGKFRAMPRENLQDINSGKITKRPRDSHVCVQCRRSKLRCDRNQPCASCVKRGDAINCTYPRIPGPGAGSGNSNSRHELTAGNNRQNLAEDRLLHLESLVKQLMEGQQTSTKSITATTSKPVTPPAVPSDPVVDAQEEEDLAASRYVGSTHWSAILDDIHELKAVLAGGVSALHEAQLNAIPIPPTSSLLLGGQHEVIFGSLDSYNLEQIISQYLPPKLEVDRLLAIYFHGETFIVPFIHTYCFQRQYRDFWADSSANVNANPLWVSTLFSICCVANLIKAAQGQHVPDASLTATISKLHTAAAQCLVLGQYYRPQPHAVEAFALYAQCKNLWTLDPSREAGAILGMVVRMAYEMGYHRDPDSFGTFTAFEGEMRRRFWSACKQVDMMISFQLGLPSNIRLENCDTRSPRNLLDADFDEHTKVLPPARSESEATRILWFIVKDRQMPSFSKVCQDALSFGEKSEAEVLQLDSEIQHMYDTIPAVLRTRPLSESIMDPPFVIMTRLYVEYIYLKSLIVLHRKYMARGVVSSTHSCVSAGKRLVSQFIAMYGEFGVGGQLHTERWMLTNFTMNDFLLGVMVLCLAVHVRRKALASKDKVSAIDGATEDEILKLLEQAHRICLEKSAASRDARRVARAVRLILDGVRLSSPRPQSAHMALAMPDLPTHAAGGNPDHVGGGGGGGGIDLTHLSLHPHDAQQRQQPAYLPELADMSFPQLDPFSFMGNDFDNFNWMSIEPQPGPSSTQDLSSTYNTMNGSRMT